MKVAYLAKLKSINMFLIQLFAFWICIVFVPIIVLYKLIKLCSCVALYIKNQCDIAPKQLASSFG